MTDDDIITAILAREGGFTNDPKDRGGPTNWGITQADLAAWRKHAVTVNDVRLMTVAEARVIYRARYLDPFEWIQPIQLRSFMVDSAVNHGITGATRLLQESLEVAQDGVIGPTTRTALNLKPWRMVLADAIADRMILYAKIVVRHPGDVRFIVGWSRRLGEFVRGLA